MLAPYLLGLSALVALPALVTFGLALFEYDLIGSADFVGLDNFRELAEDDIFRIALRNSLVFAAIAVPLRLLGALALGDLGRIFPDTDPRYAGVSSLVLLRSVRDLVAAKGGRLVNVDATIICQAPRLGGHLPEMAKHLAATLELDVDRVSVKAKSPEHLGLVGREEGIAAMAIVTVEAP